MGSDSNVDNVWARLAWLEPHRFGGVWRSLVARFVRDEEAVGSNPATPTKIIQVRESEESLILRPKCDYDFIRAKITWSTHA